MSALYDKFKDYTMMTRDSFDANIELAMAVTIPGCVVECGVWKGGMIAGLATAMGNDRHYYLFDSFEGLPWAEEVDGFAALMYQRNDEAPNYFDNCRVDIGYATEAMAMTAAPHTVVPGWFENTLPGFLFDTPIAVLRLDGDWYSSTMTCLVNLYDKVADGGLIIIDDFFAWDGCRKATLEFFSSVKKPIYFNAHRNMCWVTK